MNRFFISPKNIVGAAARLSGAEAHHALNVFRMKKGDPIVICDGEGYEYEGLIEDLGKNEVSVKITRAKRSLSEPPLEIILAQAVSKKSDKFEWVIQKATELGVSRIVPLVTERTLVRIKDTTLDARLERWRRIGLEAAKQSRRSRTPVIDTLKSLTEFLESIPRDVFCLIPWEEERTAGIRDILRCEKENNYPRPAAVVIGPEGGFTEEEIRCARKAGCIPVSLGPRILRTETAGITAVGIVMYELGDLGGAPVGTS